MRPESLNNSRKNLIVKFSNENCTIQRNLQFFRDCARYSTHFCNLCCDLSKKIIKLIDEQSDNYWFCPSCTKRTLHVVFVEKDIVERCIVFFETVKKRIKKMKKTLHLFLALWNL